MIRAQHGSHEGRPIGMAIGGDDVTPGISKELTVDDIDDVAFDRSTSVEERYEDLMNLLVEICARRTGDPMGDMAAIASHLEDRIASRESPLEARR